MIDKFSRGTLQRVPTGEKPIGKSKKCMKYNSEIHRRRTIRLNEYDYSQSGAYFVTIVTHNRDCLFGNVMDGVMVMNDCGENAKNYWLIIPQHFPNVLLDEFVIMPNHVHGIITIQTKNDVHVGVQNFEPLHVEHQQQKLQQKHHQNRYQHIIPKSIGSIVRGFKIGVTKWFRQNNDIYKVWQRNYYEHIIRNENELIKIREYIQNNPLKWEFDRENPKRIAIDELENVIFKYTKNK